MKVIILEKNSDVSTLRNDWGSVDSKWQKEAGVELDKAAILHTHAAYCANRIDMRLPRIWGDESGAAITWIGWSAMVFGWPERLAQWAVRLHEGFAGEFNVLAFGFALTFTTIWF